eukprot:1253262-Lingulodinium_polyedra.AAC.1
MSLMADFTDAAMSLKFCKARTTASFRALKSSAVVVGGHVHRQKHQLACWERGDDLEDSRSTC